MIDEWDDDYVQSKLFVDLSKYKIKDDDPDSSAGEDPTMHESKSNQAMDMIDSGKAIQQDVRDWKKPNWICSLCSASVYAMRFECFRCGKPKTLPNDRVNDKWDWNCTNCNAYVLGCKQECYKCKTPKGGSSASEGNAFKGRPTGSNTWTCTNCCASVFDWKIKCYKCDTPKAA